MAEAGDTSQWALRIDGQTVPAAGVTGGHVVAAVATTSSGSGGPPSRNITSFGYAPLQFGVGLDLGSALLTWLNDSLTGASPIKSGTVIELVGNRAKSYLDFTGARLSAFTSPSCDGKSTAQNEFRFEASIARSVSRPGDDAIVTLPRRKPFPKANFRLKIDGIPTNRVLAIEPVTFRRSAQGIAPTDFAVTFSDLDLAPWTAWAQNFIVEGHHGQTDERQGAIEFLGPDMSRVAALALRQVGIFELARATDQTTRSHRAGLYFEAGQLSVP